MSVNDLQLYEKGIISELSSQSSLSKRLLALGLVTGAPIKKVGIAPLGDPIIIEIKNFKIAIRKSDAEIIELTTQ